VFKLCVLMHLVHIQDERHPIFEATLLHQPTSLDVLVCTLPAVNDTNGSARVWSSENVRSHVPDPEIGTVYHAHCNILLTLKVTPMRNICMKISPICIGACWRLRLEIKQEALQMQRDCMTQNKIRNIELKKACYRVMTFKDTQGHYNCGYCR